MTQDFAVVAILPHYGTTETVFRTVPGLLTPPHPLPIGEIMETLLDFCENDCGPLLRSIARNAGLALSVVQSHTCKRSGNPYHPALTQRSVSRAIYWEIGYRDAMAGLPTRFANGAYLEGWYASKEQTK